MTKQIFRKCLPTLVLALSGLCATTYAQSAAPRNVENTTPFCARIATQPLTPPSIPHLAGEAELKSCDAAHTFGNTGPTNAKSPQKPESQKPESEEIKYFVKNSGDTPLADMLMATANGKNYELIGQSKQQCLRLIAQKDFDGNGSPDALVEHITACGGNCCSDTFFFVSSFDNGRFEISKEFADSWKDPVIEKWHGRWTVVVVSNNAGMNLDRPFEVVRRFALENGHAIKVEEHRRKDIKSLVEMRSEMFAAEMSGGKESTHAIEYDLDGDGTKDVISGKLWQRWGSILWSVQFSNGKQFSSNQACKRIGVLATKTHGVHDLVCDQDTVLLWNGSAYE